MASYSTSTSELSSPESSDSSWNASSDDDWEAEARKSEEEAERTAALRKKILAIHRDTTLTPAERARKVQDLMTPKCVISAPSPDAKNPPPDADRPSYFDAEKGILGCKHYRRRCKVLAPCCDTFFTCRWCHDEYYGGSHGIDRFSITTVLCMVCNGTGPIGKKCGACGVDFARLHCGKCNLIDDDPVKEVYHCDDCGVCRVGRGIGIDVFHCKKCHMCLELALDGNHICTERKLEADCPVCCQSMASTFMDTVSILSMCGHAMHTSCFNDYQRVATICPICSKSLGDMTEYWRSIDEWLANNDQLMPPEYADTTAKILCSDCGASSETAYNFWFLKCTCGSYNTKIVSTHNLPTR